MYDYLAKIILLGPSGAGKCVSVYFVLLALAIAVSSYTPPFLLLYSGLNANDLLDLVFCIAS